MLFIYGKSGQFESLNFKCLGCGKWASLYYKNNFTKENISAYITLEYDLLKEDLPSLIKHWYNNKGIDYCADIIIENLLSVRTSHSRRFTNSYTAFEAYSLKFGENYRNSSVEKHLLDNSSLLRHITNISEKNIKAYIKKIIRNRKFLIHRTNPNDNFFSQFELLYISFLLDYVVGIGLMKRMEVSDEIIEKTVERAKSTFQDMQSVNKLMNSDLLKENKN